MHKKIIHFLFLFLHLNVMGMNPEILDIKSQIEEANKTWKEIKQKYDQSRENKINRLGRGFEPQILHKGYKRPTDLDDKIEELELINQNIETVLEKNRTLECDATTLYKNIERINKENKKSTCFEFGKKNTHESVSEYKKISQELIENTNTLTNIVNDYTEKKEKLKNLLDEAYYRI